VISGSQIAATLADLDVTHVVWLPDSVLGTWEVALEATPALRLVRVCREGEAWAIAAGLWLGGSRPVVVMQNTGLFDSGDALRNVLFDLRLPLFAMIGYRGFLVEDSPDSARRFTEPVLRGWGLEWLMLHNSEDLPRLAEHYRACQAAGRAGVALVAEGRG
jgi:sulfopyruvate decarboxylase subunit alpha